MILGLTLWQKAVFPLGNLEKAPSILRDPEYVDTRVT